jgi:hypothetical protein
VLGQTIGLTRIQKSAKYGEDPSLVPRSWELIALSQSGQVEVIANRVSSYDIDQNGAIHFTNGFRVNRLSKDSRTTLFKHKIIENMRVAGAVR